MKIICYNLTSKICMFCTDFDAQHNLFPEITFFLCFPCVDAAAAEQVTLLIKNKDSKHE